MRIMSKARSILSYALALAALLGTERAGRAVIPRWLFTNSPPVLETNTPALRRTGLAADESLEIGLFCLDPGKAGAGTDQIYLLSALLHIPTLAKSLMTGIIRPFPQLCMRPGDQT